MAKGFRHADVKRVLGEFNEAIPPQFDVTGALTIDCRTMLVRVEDPVDPDLTVVTVQFDYEDARNGLQPDVHEVTRIAALFASECEGYPAKKAADAAERAERLARAATIAEAKAKEAQPPTAKGTAGGQETEQAEAAETWVLT